MVIGILVKTVLESPHWQKRLLSAFRVKYLPARTICVLPKTRTSPKQCFGRN